MNVENIRPTQGGDTASYGAVLKEVGISVERLFKSEVDLIKAELKITKKKLIRDTIQAAIAGSLLLLSVLPFIAFLVIGLGTLLEGRYWLSSLIVASVFALVGGIFTARAMKKFKEDDLTLPRTRDTLEMEKITVAEKFENIKDATKRGVA